MVHYVSYGTPGGEYGRECRAAVITEVGQVPGDSTAVGLCVLNPTGQFFNRGVACDLGKHAERGAAGRNLCGDLEYAGGTWHWPEIIR
jgi:hypothetical protein